MSFSMAGGGRFAVLAQASRTGGALASSVDAATDFGLRNLLRSDYSAEAGRGGARGGNGQRPAQGVTSAGGMFCITCFLPAAFMSLEGLQSRVGNRIQRSPCVSALSRGNICCILVLILLLP